MGMARAVWFPIRLAMRCRLIFSIFLAGFLGWGFIVTSLGWLATLETCFRFRSGESTFDVKDGHTLFKGETLLITSKYVSGSKFVLFQTHFVDHRVRYPGPYPCWPTVNAECLTNKLKSLRDIIGKGQSNIGAWPVRSAGNYMLIYCSKRNVCQLVNYLVRMDLCSSKEGNRNVENSNKRQKDFPLTNCNQKYQFSVKGRSRTFNISRN